MRSALRSPLAGIPSPFPRRGSAANPFAAYAAGGFTPKLVADYSTDTFATEGAATDFDTQQTFARASTATYFDSSGVLQTATTGTARNDAYIYESATNVGPFMLVEPAATNLITESDDFSTTWTANSATLTADDATGPDGTTSMTLLNDDSATGTGEVYVDYGVTVSTSTAYTFSIFVTADQLSWVALGTENFTTPANGETFFNLSTGAVGTTATGHTAHVEDVGGGIYRVGITFTTDGTDTAGNVRVYLADADTDITVDLDGTSSVHIYGAQVEAGSVPTSLIPTNGATVTRAADALSIAAANLPYDATNMSIAMKGRMTYADDGGSETLFNWGSTNADRLTANVLTAGGASGRLSFIQNTDGAANADATEVGNSLSPGINQAFNIATRSTTSACNLAISGTAITAGSPGGIPDLSAENFLLGNNISNLQSLLFIEQLLIWDNDLGDTGIEEASA